MMYRFDLKKYGLKRIQIISLIVFISIGLLSPFIANEDYLLAFNNGSVSVFENSRNTTSGVKALVPYSDFSIDKQNRNVGPFDSQNVSSLYYRHWLGTDVIGRDVLAGLIYGTGVALKIGFLTTIFACLIGIFFGFLSGYLGDKTLRVSRVALVIWLGILGLSIFYMIYSQGIVKVFFVVLPILSLGLFTSKFQRDKNKGVGIPLDLIVMKIIEIIRTVPDIFLILVLLSFFKEPHVRNVILLIVLIRWPTLTRLLRGDILKVKNEDFVTSAKASGLSSMKIFKDYILPVSMSSVIIASAFGFALAILIESSLSFLGIGIPLDQVTWGSLLRDARLNINAWWLALFPGLAIYLVIILFNSIGDTISNKLQYLESD